MIIDHVYKWLMLQNSIFKMKSEYLPSLKPTNRHGKSSSCMVNAIQNLVDFGKYQSTPSLNLTPKHFAPENRFPTTSHHQFFRVFAVSFREYFMDFRGRIACLKKKILKNQGPKWVVKNSLFKCAYVHIYTHLNFWRSTLRLEIHPSSTELNHCVKKSQTPFMWLPSFNNKVFFTQRTPQPKNETTEVLFTPKPPRSLNKALICNWEIMAWEGYPEIMASQLTPPYIPHQK